LQLFRARDVGDSREFLMDDDDGRDDRRSDRQDDGRDDRRDDDSFSVKGLEPLMFFLSYVPAGFAILGLNMVDARIGGEIFLHGFAAFVLLFYGFMSAPILMGTDSNYIKACMICRMALAVVAVLCGMLVGSVGETMMMIVYISWAIMAFPEAYMMSAYMKALRMEEEQLVDGFNSSMDTNEYTAHADARVILPPNQAGFAYQGTVGNDFGVGGVPQQMMLPPPMAMQVAPVMQAGYGYQGNDFGVGASGAQMQMGAVQMQVHGGPMAVPFTGVQGGYPAAVGFSGGPAPRQGDFGL